MSSAELGWLRGLGHLALGVVSVIVFAVRSRRAAPTGVLDPMPRDRAVSLAPGVVTLHGVVRRGDDTPPVRVCITQQGREEPRNRRHVWHEVKREVEVRPFWLERSGDGGAVHVEPNADVRLVAELDITERVVHDQRIRVAELRRGDHVAVVGRLSEGATPTPMSDHQPTSYRGDAAAVTGWVLRAETCVPTAARAPTAEVRRIRSFYENAALLTTLVTALVQTVVWVSFYDLAIHGVPCVASVVERTEHTERDRGRRVVTHDLVTVTTDACPDPGRRLVAPATRREFGSAREGALVEWFLVPGGLAAVPGTDASLPLWLIVVLGVITTVMLVFLPAVRRLAWWEAPLHEPGPGPIPRLDSRGGEPPGN